MTTITVGYEATNRALYYLKNNTLLCASNAAAENGTITSIEIWANTNVSGLKVGSFYQDGGAGKYTCRDSETIGAVTAGSKQTFTGLSITINAGDIIGATWTDGNVDADTSGGSGMWYDSGDQFGTAQNSYTSQSSNEMSLKGTGETAATGTPFTLGQVL